MAPVRRGLIPQKATRALRRKLFHKRMRLKRGYPPEWRSSNKPLRQLWNEYYVKTSETLYKRCMMCDDWEDLVPSYKIAKTFIDQVAKERPTKLGVRADIWRDEMKEKLEKHRWIEIEKRKLENTPHHVTLSHKL